MAWLPLLLLRRVLLLEGVVMPSWVMQLLVVGAILTLAWLMLRRGRLFAQMQQAGALALACFGASSLLFTPELVRLAEWKPAQPLQIVSGSLPEHSADHPRIVWIVLDELSEDQAFDHRLAGLRLPAFDAFSHEAIRYDNVQPVGDETDRVLPVLLTGQSLLNITYTWGNRLLMQQPVSQDWIPFDPRTTPFYAAKRRGWNTAIAGWYNPYCSLMPSSLDECFWDDREGMDKSTWNLQPGVGAIHGAMLGIEALLGSRHAKEAVYTKSALPALHWASLQAVAGHAMQMAANNNLDLMLLHLPVPHFPNVYDRHTGRISLHGNSYADNLVFADMYLGRVLNILERSPRWPQTTVIVCGDHSWRTPWWRGSQFWTAEDERISHGGQFDERPALMVHLAGETKGYVNPEDISLKEVHRILMSLVETGQVPMAPAVQP